MCHEQTRTKNEYRNIVVAAFREKGVLEEREPELEPIDAALKILDDTCGRLLGEMIEKSL